MALPGGFEQGYQQSDYTRLKDNKYCWNAVKELTKIGGARKVLRKYYNTGAVEEVGDDVIKLTGHDHRIQNYPPQPIHS